jgi:putative membrane protein
MILFSKILTLLVALIHFYFLVLEMFLWTKPKGMKTFGLKKEFVEKTKTLAANQGLYNGFLAAGLLWSFFYHDLNIRIFFFSCVIIAGIYGSYSLKKITVLFIQAVPALIGLIFTLLINK